MFAALIAGVAGGFVLTGLQAAAVVPLILEAETFEQAEEELHDAEDWAPEDGLERTLYTALANCGAGIGFALLLCAGFALRGPVSVLQGGFLGLAGFAVFYLNPALGLPPELPGMPAAPLFERQLWWLLTVLATAGGIALVVLPGQWYGKLAGLVLAALPHLIGAPHAESGAALAPVDLADRFIIATAWTNGVFWLLLGSLSAWVSAKLARV